MLIKAKKLIFPYYTRHNQHQFDVLEQGLILSADFKRHIIKVFKNFMTRSFNGN